MAPRSPEGILDVERAGAVATLTISGGAAGPCLTDALHADLQRRAAEIDLDDEVRVVVLRSRGKAFCREAASSKSSGVADGIAAVAALRVPVVCLLQGDALDAGLELAMACDLRLASPGARLGLTQLARGRLPVHGGTQRLPRLVGSARALELLLLAAPLPAREAMTIALVSRVVSGRTLWAAGARLAGDLARRAPIAQRLAKEALRAALDLPLAEGLRLEGDLYVLLQSTSDRDEGISSFRDKRRPRFRGR